MADLHLIVTHPGGAHKDEFLACSVLLARHRVPLVRREPAPADLADPRIAVVDVGHRHEPALHNFDHHQLPRDHPPTCSLSLVLQHLGLYDDARRYCEWLETAEWFDCRGAVTTAGWLGVAPELLPRLASPIDTTLLRRFALATRLDPGDALWEMMRLIGEDLVAYVQTLRERVAYLGRHAVIWSLELAGRPAEILFLPRTDPLPEDPSFGLEHFLVQQGLAERVIGFVSPDRRSAGYGLSRFRDNPRLDFTRIAGEPDVHFAHVRGFVAKTSAADPGRLRTLVAQAGAESA